MAENQGAPWSSILFVSHIVFTMTGMLGFIIMFVYLLSKGTNHYYKKLRIFQYKILLNIWVFGVIIALTNFFIKVMFGIRIYDYF